MSKYLINSNDIEIENVSGTDDLKFNFATGNSLETNIGDLSNLNTTDKTDLVSAINEVNGNLTNLNTYSTSETVIGEWLGDTLYRKVISTGTLPNASTNDIPHNIINLKKVVNVKGYAYRSQDEFYIPLPFASPENLEFCISIGVLDTDIRITTGTDRTAFMESYVILEYTKN